jgi:hypothetical protein
MTAGRWRRRKRLRSDLVPRRGSGIAAFEQAENSRHPLIRVGDTFISDAAAAIISDARRVRSA